MLKYLIVLTLIMNLSSNVFAGAGAKLIDYMVSGSGVLEVLGKYGIKGNDAKQVESYVASSIGAIGNKKNLSKAELKEAIGNLVLDKSLNKEKNKADAIIRKQLQMLLDKPDSEITKEDVVTAINHLVLLADRHGKSVIITCAECVNDNLAKNGFKFTVETIKSTSQLKIISETISQDPAVRGKDITNIMNKLQIGDYSKVSPSLVSPSEEKVFAMFLQTSEKGNADQKAFFAAVKRISTKDGKTNIIDPKNPHKFWKVIADDMSSEDMRMYTSMLQEVAAREDKDKVTAEEAFNRIFKEKAQGNPDL
ncbi:MAG: hypothetical protein Q7U04_14170, partial [Bacteriovorax sp.]|nr:hypothetical protein [Bacteriovorax sp.]